MGRNYDQHCGLAHALDLLGERWTLLIVREFMAGPRRYTDLSEGLVSIPSNVLAARLREMQAGGLVRHRRLEPPAASVLVYELTASGEGLRDALSELARWGMRTLPPTLEGRAFRAHWLVLALRASFDPVAAEGLSESYEFDIEGDDVISFEIDAGRGNAHVGRSAEPAVRIRADAETLIALTSGALAAGEAIARGAQIEGEPDALLRLRQILPSRHVEAAS